MDIPALRAKRTELRARSREIARLIADLQAQLFASSEENAEIDAAARQLAAGKVETPVAVPIAGQIGRLRSEAEITDRAIRLLAQQIEVEVDRERLAIAQDLRPAHRAATARIARAVAELAAANAAERAIRVKVGGPHCLLPETAFPGVGDFADMTGYGSVAHNWLDRVVQLGVLTAAEAEALKRGQEK